MTTTPPVAEPTLEDRFLTDLSQHQMTVLLDTFDDAQVYRHLRLAQPGTWVYRFDLITWPGHLTITGDLGTYTFARVYDMVDFFRPRRGDHALIDYRYWAEKTPGGITSVKVFDFEHYRERVSRELEQTMADRGFDARRKELTRRLADGDLFDLWSVGSNESAHEVVAGFRPADASGGVDDEPLWRDTWEWDLQVIDGHFKRVCVAIRHGINLYLEAHPDRFIPEGQRPHPATITE